MISKVSPKAGIYFSHYECLGHISRVMAVGEIFRKRFSSGDFFFIQAGVEQTQAKIDEIGPVYTLPGSFMDRRNFREPIQTGINVDERTQACLDIITRQKPDLFLTEFFPLGHEECRYELISSLVKASRQGAQLWAVAGYPLLTGTDHEWRQKILKLYKQIIIFSPSIEKEYIAESFSQLEDRQKYLEFFEHNASKITFAGYLLPELDVVRDDENNNLPKPPVPKGACRVAVLRGGGAVYPKLIAEAILASDLLGEEYYLTVVAGPSTTPQEWYFFATLFAKKKVKNLALFRSVSNYEGLIEQNDVCVSTVGYHTSVMLLKHRKKAVLIPFEGYGAKLIHEQPARAAMLRKMIGAKILSMQDLTANTLTTMIKEAAALGPVCAEIPQEWFKGAGFLDKAFERAF